MMRRGGRWPFFLPRWRAPSLAGQIAALRAELRDLRDMIDADMQAAVDAITETTSAMASLQAGVDMVVKALKDGHDAKMVALEEQIAALKEQLANGRVVAATDLGELQVKTGQLRVANRQLAEAAAMLADAIPANTMPPVPAQEPVMIETPPPAGAAVAEENAPPDSQPPMPEGDGPLGDQPLTAPMEVNNLAAPVEQPEGDAPMSGSEQPVAEAATGATEGDKSPGAG